MQSSPGSAPDRDHSPPHPAADYQQLFSLSLDLVCVAGLDGYFKHVNPAWTRVLGWSEAELLARPVEEFMHPDDRERTLKARANLAQGVPVRGLENRYLCKDGSYRWLAWQSVLEPTGHDVLAVARDVTERRQLEHDRLVLSKLESTGVLAGGIAHDFNNLLATLLLNLEMVSLSDPTTPRQEFHLQQARQAIDAAKALTQQFIAFADGGVPARRISDLSGLLQQAVDLALKGSSLEGECVIAPDLWPADVDEEQLGQVIRGLLLNAREATAPGGRVRLQADNTVLALAPGADAPAGDYLRITITDEGSGIPVDVLPKIFDPYFSTKQRGARKGMGLGLTLCRTIIQKHGGTIAVDSQPGRGTRVTCYLPAAHHIIPRAAPAVLTGRPSSPRVLVMEDEQLFRETIGLTLQQLGYEVELAREGGEAVALFDRAADAGHPFAAVVLDLTVRGGMGGSEAMKLLRQRDPAVRAVLMTGYTNEDTFRDYAQHGFRGALAKPFSAESLRLLLAEILAPPAGDEPCA